MTTTQPAKIRAVAIGRRGAMLGRRAAAGLMALVVAFVVPVSEQQEAIAGGHTESLGEAVAHLPGGKRVAADARAPRVRSHKFGLSAIEPTVGVTEDGAVFVTAFQTNTRIEVVRSQDQGKSWDIVSPDLGGQNAHLVSFDPYLYVDKDTSRVFTIDLTVACSYLSFSDDRGESWITNPLACGRPINDHQTLFGGPPVASDPVGYPNVLYYCWNDVATSSCSKSIDGGLTFVPTGTPAFVPGQGGTFCGGLHGHGFVGRDGTVYLPKGHCGQPWLAISTDEGATWTRRQVADIGTADHEAGVAADAKGNIYYTWIGADRLPYLAVSRDGGETWSKPMMVGAPGVTEANLPGIDVGRPGRIALVYMGSENARGPIGQRDYSGVTWNGYITITDRALAKHPLFFSGRVNERKDPLMIGRCGPGRCPGVYDFIDVVIGPDGTPWGAFVDGCPGGDACRAIGGEGFVARFVGGPKL